MNPSQRIDQMIAELTDWRGKIFAGIRKSILAADREIIEEWKWMGSPVWSHGGMIAVGNAHKDKVKLTFAHGARLPDPDKLFNAGLEGNMRRIKQWDAEITADVLTNILQPGRFAQLDQNLTIRIRERQPGGVLAGIFVDDRRDPKERVTIIADHGVRRQQPVLG